MDDNLLDFDEKTDSQGPLYSKAILRILVLFSTLGVGFKIFDIPLADYFVVIAPAALTGYIIGQWIVISTNRSMRVAHLFIALLFQAGLLFLFELYNSTNLLLISAGTSAFIIFGMAISKK